MPKKTCKVKVKGGHKRGKRKSAAKKSTGATKTAKKRYGY